MNQSKPLFGPHWALQGPLCWVQIALEQLSKVTLDCGIQGNDSIAGGTVEVNKFTELFL